MRQQIRENPDYHPSILTTMLNARQYGWVALIALFTFIAFAGEPSLLLNKTKKHAICFPLTLLSPLDPAI